MHFTYKGINSTEMGVTVLTQPPVQSPESRTWTTFIDNKDGADYNFMGFKPMIFQMEIAVEGKENIDRVLGWLTGEGKFIRSDFPDLYRNVHIIQGINLSRVVEWLYRGTIEFQVIDPYWYKVEDEWEVYHGSNPWKELTWERPSVLGREGPETKAPLDVFKKGYTRNKSSVYQSRWYVGGKLTEPYDGEIIYNDYMKVYDAPSQHLPGWRYDTKGKRSTFFVHIEQYPANVHRTFKVYYQAYDSKDGKVGEQKSVSVPLPRLEGEVEIEIDDYESVDYINVGIGVLGKNFYLKPTIADGPRGDYYNTPWEDLPDSEKPVRAWDNMCLHTEEIRSGYWRVRTTGGSSKLKVLLSTGIPPVGETRSVGIDIMAVNSVAFYTQYGKREIINKGERRFIKTQGTSSGAADFQIRLEAVDDSAEPLDVMLSNAYIYQGDNSKNRLEEITVEKEIYSKDLSNVPKKSAYERIVLDELLFEGTLEVTTELNMASVPNEVMVDYFQMSRFLGEEEVAVDELTNKIKSSYDIKYGELPNVVRIFKDVDYYVSEEKEAILLNTKIVHRSKEVKSSDTEVVNEGNIKSYPLIHLVKTNGALETEITINDSKFRYEFPEGEEEVYINLEGLRAGVDHRHTGYSREDVRDRNLYVIRDKGFYLNPGPNKISATGNVEIRIKKKDRWI